MSVIPAIPGSIAFFCKPNKGKCGYPLRAQTCNCEPRMFIADAVDPDHCEHCGHYTVEAVDRTWQTQARHMTFNARGMLARK